MIEFLIGHFQDAYKIAVLSRGYKRKTKGFRIATKESTVEELGDEPFQIHSKFPKVKIAVDANRTRGIHTLKKRVDPQVILLDDGFQHRKVRPGYSILLTSYLELFTDDWYLPTGNLRDSKKEARRANLIVVTKCPFHMGQKERENIVKQVNSYGGQPVLFSGLSYGLPTGRTKTISWEDLKNIKVTLVTGIAQPTPLVSFLKDKGLVFEHLQFRDHHYFTENELRIFSSKECILTTEKDYVRLNSKLDNLYYLPVRHEFLFNGEAVLRAEWDEFMRQSS